MGIIFSIIYSIIFLGVVSSIAHHPFGNTLVYYGLIGAIIIHTLNAAISIKEKQNVSALLHLSIAIIFGSLFMYILGQEADVLVFLIGSAGCGTYLFLNRKAEKSRLSKLTYLTLVLALTVLILIRSEVVIPATLTIIICFILTGLVIYSIYLKYLLNYPEGQEPKVRAISGNLSAFAGIILLLIYSGVIPTLYSPNPQPEKAELDRMDKEQKELLQKEIDRVHHIAGKIIEK